MPSIINVLIESFQLLKQRPRLFVPKLASTSIGALWMIGLLSGYGSIYLYAATGPVLVLLAVFVSVMMAAMVKHGDEEDILRKGWDEAAGRAGQLVATTAALFIASFLLYIPLAAGAVTYYFSGSYLTLVAGGVITGILMLSMAFMIYFFPISLLEEGSVLKGFSGSAKMSVSNSLEVGFLTLLSLILLGVASFTGDQGMKYAGYAGFFSLRMVSGVITTYVFVVSPKYYLSD